MKTTYYLVTAAGLTAAALIVYSQYSGRSGARELPPIPPPSVPLIAEATQSPSPFVIADVTLPPVVTGPNEKPIVQVAMPPAPPAPALPPLPNTPSVALPPIPGAPTAPSITVEPNALPALPAAPATPMKPITPAAPTTPAALPAIPATPAIPAAPALPMTPAVTPPSIPSAPSVQPVAPSVQPRVPATPVVPPAPAVTPPPPAQPMVQPVKPATPTIPQVQIVVPSLPEQPGETRPVGTPTQSVAPPPMVVLPQPAPQPVPTPQTQTQNLPLLPPPGSDPVPATPATGKFVLLKGNKITEGSVSIAGDKAIIRVGSLERAIPKSEVLFVGETKDDIYRFVLSQVPATDPTSRLSVARWCMFAGLREQALTEAKEVLKLQPTNTNAADMARSLEESLKQFPPEGAVSAAQKPAGGTLTAEIEPDVTPEGATTFAARAQPVLANLCMDCHARPDYPGAFKLIRVTGFEVGPQSTKANLRATTAQLKKEDPINSPLLTKALATHGGMKQPAFVSRQAAGYRALEAWVGMAVQPVLQPMTPPAQPVYPPAPTPMMPPTSVPVANSVLPPAEPVATIPPATNYPPTVAMVPTAPPAAPTPPPVPTVPTIPLIPSEPQTTELPAVPVVKPALPTVETLPPLPLPVPSTPPVEPSQVPAVPVVLPTPPSLPQAETHSKPPASASPMAPAVAPHPKPVGRKPASNPSQFGTAAPPKPAPTGPTGGDEFDPGAFNQGK